MGKHCENKFPVERIKTNATIVRKNDFILMKRLSEEIICFMLVYWLLTLNLNTDPR
jgi:hypothetical protein